MINPERCSCGAREKNKCNKESEHGSGKACIKFMKDAWDEHDNKIKNQETVVSYQELGYKLPPEYTSFIHLHPHLGDIGTVEAICKVWNSVNGWQNNSLRIREVNENLGHIIITGRCTDEELAQMICNYLVCTHVRVKYEKTITTICVEV